VIAFLIAVQYGIVAVAAAFVLRTYVLSPVDLTVLTRLLPMGFTEYLRQLVTPLVCCAFMAAAILGVQSVSSGWLGLLAGIAAGVVTYGLALRLVNADAFREDTGIIREVVQPT
jgi:PST family polysaccharide transporter